MLRIASICRELPNPDNHSTGVFVLRRLEALARQADVRTIQLVNYFPLLRPLPAWAHRDRYANADLTITPEPMFYVPGVLKPLDGYWLSRAVVRGLRRLAAERRIDLVDAHFGYPEGVGSFIAARRLGIPVFVTLRGFEEEYIKRPLIGPQIARTIREADGCICVSYSLQELALRCGALPEKTTVIHNAIDTKTFFPSRTPESKTRLGLDADSPLIVSVGHLISRKRHHILIAAFAAVLRKYPTATLAIVGGESFESRYPMELRNLIAKLGIGPSVRFAGNVAASNVAEWLRAADVFALVTQREGCCNAVLEALASGLPVVTTPVGDNACFVRDGENGFLIPVDDVERTADALVRSLSRRSWDRDSISASLGVGDWSRVATQVLDFFRARLQRDMAPRDMRARVPA